MPATREVMTRFAFFAAFACFVAAAVCPLAETLLSADGAATAADWAAAGSTTAEAVARVSLPAALGATAPAAGAAAVEFETDAAPAVAPATAAGAAEAVAFEAESALATATHEPKGPTGLRQRTMHASPLGPPSHAMALHGMTVQHPKSHGKSRSTGCLRWHLDLEREILGLGLAAPVPARHLGGHSCGDECVATVGRYIARVRTVIKINVSCE